MSAKMFESIAPLERMLDFHTDRHGVLATNLSHAETPGYRPRDMVFAEALDSATSMLRTDERHLGGGMGPSPEVYIEQDPVGVDDNGVRMEKAMAQLGANKIRFDAGVEIARRRLALIKYAASDGRG